ncbi:hypothetical protein ACWD5R_43095 [Streptomyces sp. NPDC002514]|uniref:hypothetical protein n=1 Tax=Streptomyces sp. NPDC001270 TaxID=3364554 RepID=UPI0036CA1747
MITLFRPELCEARADVRVGTAAERGFSGSATLGDAAWARSAFMDSGVVSALVSVPVSLFAAVTAYGAGKVQGRSAVDSVRRASQRESYAQLLAACYAFTSEADRVIPALDGGVRSIPAPPPLPGTPEEAVLHLDRLVDRINECGAVVTLDGPPHIARLAHGIRHKAQAIVLNVDSLVHRVPGRDYAAPFASYEARFRSAVDVFAEEASAHLNTGLLRHRWWRLRSRDDV